ncbi:MAG: cytochrome C oxidase subunit II [Deltaproteobacteria bacterium]|nr:cytochrome C oxidase subunit II [Deltaproteobacteria bacterium]MBT4264426.1 cytochrome C oxidase subunit II [Deltaproteobacteria bacterium]MBT4643089.1 cytochrome C oxidase subunit II [Deltaproteobacteria bacterium]MBT6498885.1 cytochrome C oxidase subunit II [Deltaproteobacteria bacterium]MBT6615808.1 cytochrome C oxidase subunit II [Deltaproteobacteria bacterium]
MAKGPFQKGPDIIHPEKASAVGSRNSIYREGRNEYAESKLLIDEEVDKILNHVTTKLPPEVLEKLHVGGTVKDILHSYFNQGLQNMYNRYLVSVEDEMGKKFSHLVDQEESQSLNQYASRDVSSLLNNVGGSETFNNEGIERSVVNVYENLQEHLGNGVSSLETKTQKILNGKLDIGALLNGNFTNLVLKSNFRDNPLKPETVNDVNLVLNMSESELVEPIYHYQVASEVIIRNVLSDHILQIIEKKIQTINEELVGQKKDTLNKNVKVFEKINQLESHIGFGEQNADSPQFAYMASKFLDAIRGVDAEIDFVDYDPLNIRENVQRIVDEENIRNRGYNVAVSSLIGVLDDSQLGYQHIENFKNCRKIIIREYADMNPAELPDEHYVINLTYQDDLQLREERLTYCQQMDEFDDQILRMIKVFEKLKNEEGALDFDMVSDQILKDKKSQKAKKQEDEEFETYRRGEEAWESFSFILPEKNDLEKLNETFRERKEIVKNRLKRLRQQVSDRYLHDFPPDRIILEQRLNFLEEEYERFGRKYNPFHAHPGLILDISASTVKRRETTINSMSNVVAQFISRISTGFVDSSYEEFHQRKRLEQETDTQVFGTAT